VTRPVKPNAGDELLHGFAAELAAYAGESLVFERVPAGGLAWALENATGTGAFVELELTRLPADDPRTRFAVVLVICRGTTAGDNASIILAGQPAAPFAAMSYNSGVANAGGAGGPFLVPVGGASRRSIWWQGTATLSRNWIVPVGWWRTLE
jgi:hypothetical protein